MQRTSKRVLRSPAAWPVALYVHICSSVGMGWTSSKNLPSTAVCRRQLPTSWLRAREMQRLSPISCMNRCLSSRSGDSKLKARFCFKMLRMLFTGPLHLSPSILLYKASHLHFPVSSPPATSAVKPTDTGRATPSKPLKVHPDVPGAGTT